jgi:probable phosphoglycerate mutase
MRPVFFYMSIRNKERMEIMMKLGLIRHGKTDWNAAGKIQGVTDIPLNEEGISQAVRLAERLVRDGDVWNGVVTSPLVRAKDTGIIIAERLGIPLLEPESLLAERSFGLIEGSTESERLERWGPQWRSHPDAGIEPDASVRERGSAFVALMQEKYPDSSLLVVTHGSYLAQLLEVLCDGLSQSYLLNMSYSILEFDGLKWTPLLHNCTLHIES